MQTIIFYSLAIGLLILSGFKDKKKTKQALMKAWKSFSFIVADLVGIMLLVGVILTFTNP